MCSIGSEGLLESVDVYVIVNLNWALYLKLLLSALERPSLTLILACWTVLLILFW